MIRLYGPFSGGNSSFHRVAQGMRLGLEAHGKLAGTVAIDDPDVVHGDFREADDAGFDAPVAVFVGDFRLVSLMRKLGKHRERWVLLPVNSTWMPTDVLEHVERYATGLIAPSRWCAAMLKTHTQLPVRIWQHGVAPEFQPMSSPDLDQPRGNDFLALHLTSTKLERKGTRLLIEAWATAFGNSEGSESLLIVSPSVDNFDLVRDAIPLERGRKKIILRGRANLNPYDMALLMNVAHAVIQPSRGEAFGLVPLEALACGVPIVATNCTGHQEFLKVTDGAAWMAGPGWVRVSMDIMAPIDDGPGAQAPTVIMEGLIGALKYAAEHKDELKRSALEASVSVRKKWSWPAVTERALADWPEASS